MASTVWWAAVLTAGVAAGVAGHGRVIPAAASTTAARAWSAETTQALVGKLTLSEHAAKLAGLSLAADDVWVNEANPAQSDYGTGKVMFYRTVPIEVMESEKGRPLRAAERAREAHTIQALRKRIDAAWRERAAPGQLVNLYGEIWTLGQIATHFTWTASSAGMAAGRPAVILHFEPLAGQRPHTRIERVLDATAGDIVVDGQTGQILRGVFHSEKPIHYGGWLAHLAFHGAFSLQAAGDCWVINDVSVEVQGRVMFSRMHGTQINTYSLAVVAGPQH